MQKCCDSDRVGGGGRGRGEGEGLMSGILRYSKDSFCTPGVWVSFICRDLSPLPHPPDKAAKNTPQILKDLVE